VNLPDSSLRAWLPGEIYPSFFGDSVETSEAYIALVTSGFEISRRCFAGDLKSCGVALRLDDANDSMVVATLATPAERLSRVQVVEGYFRRARALEVLVECRAGSDVACTELLKTVPAAMLPHPLAPQTRSVLVRLALRTGGRNAYGRLMEHPTAPMGERLAHAAGVPLDTLLAKWRGKVVAGRPMPVSISLLGVLTGMGWFVLLGYFGLRSSRWRMG
jgi:hypothetical protein